MSRKIFKRAKIFPLQPGTKKPLPGTRGFRDAICNAIIPTGYNIGCVPASVGLVCIDLDPGHDEAWVAEHLPPTLTVKTPHGWHLYYRCGERFGNGRLGKHIDVRSANGYAMLPPSQLTNGGGTYEWSDEREPVALPEGIRGMLRAEGEYDNRPYDPQADDGDDNPSNLAKARMLLKNTDSSDNGYNIACRLRRDIGLSYDAATEVFAEWSDTLDWPWDHDKIRSVCRNAGRYGNGATGQFAGAGVDAYEEPASMPHPKVRLVLGANSKMEKIKWLWNDWLAHGKYHVLAGDKGAGKSTLVFSLTAIISIGGKWPDGTQAPLGDTLVWSGEDAWGDTILPRFVASGGDLKRIYHVGDIEFGDNRRQFDPSTDMPALVEAARRIPNLKLVMIDPLVMAVGAGRDSHKNAEVRRGLQPLVDFAEQCDVAIIGITHFTKGTEGRNPTDRVTGSLAFGALARIVLGASADEDGQQRRLVRIASNIGPSGGGVEYQLQQRVLDSGIHAQQVVWGSILRGAARELLGGSKQKALDIAKAWLAEYLKEEEKPAKEIRDAAMANGITVATLTRAKEALEIKPKKHKDFWVWELPSVEWRAL